MSSLVDAPPLSTALEVQSRFTRSISLRDDLGREDALDGYCLTPLTNGLLERLVSEALAPSGARAWSFTGPFGSGKSSFALLAASLFSAATLSELEAVRRRFQGRLAPVPTDPMRFVVVTVTGSRVGLVEALRCALLEALSGCRWPSEALSQQLDALRNNRADDPLILADRVGDAAQAIVAAGGGGLLLIVDELGKCLEHASRNPEQGDLYVLQTIAEKAARSPAPVVVMTLLHQAFEAYARNLGPSQRQEWAKVQGRYEDVPFQEPSVQAIRLMADALQPLPWLEAVVGREARRVAEESVRLGASPSLAGDDFVEVLARLYPLHPLCSLCLPHVFRRHGQQERSLFAFLTSREPHSLKDFLGRHHLATPWPFFRLNDLYDHLMAMWGDLVPNGDGRPWARAAASLDRLGDAPAIEVEIVKAIGVMGLVREVGGLKASPALLVHAFDGAYSPSAIQGGLERLTAKGILTYRRYSDSYRLWDGSDHDLDALVDAERAVIAPDAHLVPLLNELAPPVPMVARHFSHVTGAIRTFDVAYASAASLKETLDRPLGRATGRVVYVLCPNAEEAERAESAARAIDRPDLLIAVLGNAARIIAQAHDVAAHRAVLATGILADDPIAAKELDGRLTDVTRLLLTELDQVLATSRDVRWFWRSVPISLTGARALNAQLTTMCGAILPETPHLRNELLNRDSLSSAAAAARRELLERMLIHEDKQGLGILAGAPPELGMYRAVLLVPGIHRQAADGAWGFHPPCGEDQFELKPAWERALAFIQAATQEPASFAALFEHLRQPPVGMKAGPIPVLVLALLLHLGDEVAVYEAGTFVPQLTMSHIDRLLKDPAPFAVRHCPLGTGRRAQMSAIARAFDLEQDAAETPIRLVRALMHWVGRLPPFARHTRRLGACALRLRDALLQAVEPHRLLFEDLPRACDRVPAEDDPDLFGTLAAAAGELSGAFSALLNEMSTSLGIALTAEGDAERMRTDLAARAKRLGSRDLDLELKAFCLRLADAGSDQEGWLASIGDFLAKKGPRFWTDAERDRFAVALDAIAPRFLRQERLSLVAGSEAVRLGVTDTSGRDLERIVPVHPADRPAIDQAKEALVRALQELGLVNDDDRVLVVLGELTRDRLAALPGRDS